MMKFIVLLREPDGRTTRHSEEEAATHQAGWKEWLSTWAQQDKVRGGSGLTLDGRIIKSRGNTITTDLHRNHSEIVGGYLLLNAADFDEAVQIISSCPIYDFGGYAEIRELQNQNSF
jgi:hypothetical protein